MQGVDSDIFAFVTNTTMYLTIEASRSAITLSLKSMTRILQTSVREGSTPYEEAQIHYTSGLRPEGDKI